MEFSIGKFHVKIDMRPISPFKMSRRAKHRLAERVLREASNRHLCETTKPGKIDRIRTLRQIAINEGWQGWDLKTCKDWVEAVFADNGNGEIAL